MLRRGWRLSYVLVVKTEAGQRWVGLVFLSGEQAASIFREAGKFFLWENRIIGEANVA